MRYEVLWSSLTYCKSMQKLEYLLNVYSGELQIQYHMI